MIKMPLEPKKLLKYPLYMQVRFLKHCKRMDDASNSTFKWKNLRTIKMKVLTL